MENLKQVWSLQFGGSLEDSARDVIIDKNGDIYVAGITDSYLFEGNSVPGIPNPENPEEVAAGILSKVSSDGVIQWTQFIGNGTFNYTYAVTFGVDGSVYVVGDGADRLQGNYLAKYLSNGEFEWIRDIGGDGRDVKVDSTGSVVVLTDYPARLLKFSDGKNEQWSIPLNVGNEEGEVAIGSDDSIYVAGRIYEHVFETDEEVYGEYDALLTKYSSDGTKVWERVFGGSDRDKAHGVIESSDGSIYVTGATRSSVFDGQYNSVLEKDEHGDGIWECFLIKFSPDGEKQWTRLFGGSDREKAYDLAEGVDGSIFVVGETSSSDFVGAIDRGSFLANFSEDGVENWSSLVVEDVESISIACDGTVVIPGSDSGFPQDIVLEKYVPLIDIYQIPEVDCVASFTLSSIYKLQESEVKDLIVGTKERDLIIGTAENEILVGRGSKDKISGGKGADGFLFDKFNEFSKKGMNIVEDFDVKEGDAILLARNDFGLRMKIKLKVVAGKKSASKASAKKSNIVYDEKRGLLYFNENGKEEGWGDGGLFAKLQGAPELGATDFTIV